jgi:hypothetical protein
MVIKTKAEIAAIHSDLVAALKTVGEKYNISFSTGSLRYNEVEFGVKLTGKFGNVSESGEIVTTFIPPFGFNDSIVNATVHYAGVKFKVIDVKRTSFVCKDLGNGKTYLININKLRDELKKCTEESVHLFGVKSNG